MGKITQITEKKPHAATLPDGIYIGSWGGYVIELHHQGIIYELKTEEGVRGSGIKVVVTINNGIATYEQVSN